MKIWTLLEEQTFETKLKDGTSVLIECHIDSKIYQEYGHIYSEDLRFSNISLILYHDKPFWNELPVRSFSLLDQYISKVDMDKIESEAIQKLKDEFMRNSLKDLVLRF